jgi:hypothetical protein
MKIHYDADCPDHPIEKVGRELRSMMTWLEPVEK